MVINLWSLHHDEEEWRNPETFDPGEPLCVYKYCVLQHLNRWFGVSAVLQSG